MPPNNKLVVNTAIDKVKEMVLSIQSDNLIVMIKKCRHGARDRSLT